MTKKWLVLMGLILIVVASGCSRPGSSPKYEMARPQVAETVVVEREVAYAPAEAGDRYSAADVDEDLTVVAQNRMIIYTIHVELVVKDTATTMAQIESLGNEMGGFVSNSTSWKDEGRLRANITVRVPADRLDEALARIRDLALDVESESRSGADATEEFTDLEARLRNLRTTEEELLELLKTRQETTGDTEAILEVHRYLTDIRGQIEQIQGRMNYLSNLSAMATIHVGLTPDVLAQPIVVGKWQPQGTAKEAIQALIKALEFLVDALIWIVLLVIPVLIVILLPLFLVFRAILKWRRKRRRPTA
jgi:hypothetical protein